MNNINKKSSNDLVICFVGNFKYLRRNFKNISYELSENAKYTGDILLITSIFTPTFLIKSIRKEKKLHIFRFQKINFTKETKKILLSLNTGDQPNRYKTKSFQWEKLHLFDERLKKWRFIFYLDLNMHFHHDLNPILSIRPTNKIFARADSYPSYSKILESQFDKTNILFNKLKTEFNLKNNKYFQTGILFFDTNLISKETKNDLINLTEKYPISITNEQGIMNLYFGDIKNSYVEMPEMIQNKISYFYWMIEGKEIIITKQVRTQYK
tara:strand:- start:232 stop:1035 length:804 start_codon:yes stop_codon:yes gene_type:complete